MQIILFLINLPIFIHYLFVSGQSVSACVIHYYHYLFLCSHCFRFCQWRPLQAVFFDMPYFLTFWNNKPRLILYFPCPSPEVGHFSNYPDFLVISFSSQDVGSLSGQSQRIYIRTHRYTQTHTHTYTSIFMSLCRIHEFTPILMSIPIRYYRDYSSFPSVHICNLSISEKLRSLF